MSSWASPSENDDHRDIQRIFLHARNRNLLWRYEIMAENGYNATEYVSKMEDDIFWDLSEIDRELENTKSLKMTNLPIIKMPKVMSQPIMAQIIDLSNNVLETIPVEFFNFIPNAKIFRIANNNLKSIPWQGLSQLKFLKVIDFRNNPWDDTFLIKFKSYLRMFHPQLQRLFL